MSFLNLTGDNTIIHGVKQTGHDIVNITHDSHSLSQSNNHPLVIDDLIKSPYPAATGCQNVLVGGPDAG